MTGWFEIRTTSQAHRVSLSDSENTESLINLGLCMQMLVFLWEAMGERAIFCC